MQVCGRNLLAVAASLGIAGRTESESTAAPPLDSSTVSCLGESRSSGRLCNLGCATHGWTPADLCGKTVAARAKQARQPAIKVYPGAGHDFDTGGLPMLSSSGHMIGGNSEASADSYEKDEGFPRCAAQGEVVRSHS